MSRRRTDDPTTAGLLRIDKPPGPTSHDVVGRVRRALGVRRVGHSGTLDPPATGLLLLGVGWATRLLRFTGELPKTYVAEVVFGAETTTLDATGEVVAEAAMDFDEAALREALALLTGDILQVPPMVSAVKVAGEALHHKARRGEEVEREPRPVTVHALDLLGLDGGRATLEVRCSAGTYVRTLASDLGRSLGGYAHVGELRRTAVGPHRVEEASSLDDVDDRGAGALAPPSAVMEGFPALHVDADTAVAVSRGRPLPADLMADPGPTAVLDPAGNLLAVYETQGSTARPACVAPPESVPRCAAGLARDRVRSGGRRVPEAVGAGSARPEQPGVERPGVGGVTGGDGHPAAKQVIEHLQPCPPPPAGCVVTIGNFDGVHKGHRAVIADLRREARAIGAASAVVTFDPHTLEVIRPEVAPRLLTTRERKLELLAETGIDYALVVTFDDVRAAQPADDFVREVLAGCLHARLVMVGDDFRFGHRAAGDVRLLREMGERLGFSVAPVEIVMGPEGPYSSTAIRRAVDRGDVDAATEALGRPPEVRGEVVHGDHLGRGLGFPTANLATPTRLCLPAVGVYAGRVRLPDGEVDDAVVNVGFRPPGHHPREGGVRPPVEAPRRGWAGDLYGAVVDVSFVARIRPEERFASLDDLKAQIGLDAVRAKEILAAGSARS